LIGFKQWIGRSLVIILGPMQVVTKIVKQRFIEQVVTKLVIEQVVTKLVIGQVVAKLVIRVVTKIVEVVAPIMAIEQIIYMVSIPIKVHRSSLIKVSQLIIISYCYLFMIILILIR